MIDHLKQRLLDVVQPRVATLIPTCLEQVRDICPTMPKDYKIGFSAPTIDLGRQFARITLRVDAVTRTATVRCSDPDHFEKDLTALITDVATEYAKQYLAKDVPALLRMSP